MKGYFSNNTQFTPFDQLHILTLACSLRLFRPIIKANYRFRELYDPNVFNERHVYFFRNGKRLIKKFKRILKDHQYPATSQDYDLLIEKLRDGYSFSRFGDGEYSIIKGATNRKVYFDTATTEARSRLLEVLTDPVDNHLIGLIHSDVVATQLTFANTMSLFGKVPFLSSRIRMPIFAEYDDDMLNIYNSLGTSNKPVFEAGLFRNTVHQQHVRIWQGKDVLYVTGSVKTSEKYNTRLQDMFADAKSFELIETVTENALSNHYDEILNSILSHPAAKQKMILLSQGMAATVLAHDLAKRGFHAIDLGQPFVYYESRHKNS